LVDYSLLNWLLFPILGLMVFGIFGLNFQLGLEILVVLSKVGFNIWVLAIVLIFTFRVFNTFRDLGPFNGFLIKGFINFWAQFF